VFFAARHPGQARSFTLANPLLDYEKRFVDDEPYWHEDRIGAAEGRQLTEYGFVEHSPDDGDGLVPLVGRPGGLRLGNRSIGQVWCRGLPDHGKRASRAP